MDPSDPTPHPPIPSVSLPPEILRFLDSNQDLSSVNTRAQQYQITGEWIPTFTPISRREMELLVAYTQLEQRHRVEVEALGKQLERLENEAEDGRRKEVRLICLLEEQKNEREELLKLIQRKERETEVVYENMQEILRLLGGQKTEREELIKLLQKAQEKAIATLTTPTVTSQPASSKSKGTILPVAHKSTQTPDLLPPMTPAPHNNSNSDTMKPSKPTNALASSSLKTEKSPAPPKKSSFTITIPGSWSADDEKSWTTVTRKFHPVSHTSSLTTGKSFASVATEAPQKYEEVDRENIPLPEELNKTQRRKARKRIREAKKEELERVVMEIWEGVKEQEK